MELQMFLTCIMRINTLYQEKRFVRALFRTRQSTRNTGSFLKVLLATITGFFVISLVGIGARVFGAHLSKPKVHSQENFNVCTSEDNSGLIDCSCNIDELEEHCKSVVEKIREALGSSGEIMFNSNVGAWIGTVPSYLRGTTANRDLRNYTAEEISSEPSDSEKKEPEIQDASQDIASFQGFWSQTLKFPALKRLFH